MAIIQGNAKGGASGFYPKEIEQSLRFNDDDSAYLSWTPASAGNRKTWTWSGWVKRGNLGTQQIVFGVRSGSTFTLFLFNTANQLRLLSSSSGLDLLTTQVFRDPSSHYHIQFSLDTTQATAADRCSLWVNGQKIEDFSTTIYPPLNAELSVSNTLPHWISGQDSGGGVLEYLDGYLSEVHFVDGQALDATSFGEFKNGVWVPKNVSVTYGTNGFYLPFRNDYTVEGMSTVTYRGNGSDQYIGGVGFEPDLVWTKRRDATNSHYVFDILRGNNSLNTDYIGGDNPISGFSLGDPDGFTLTSSGAFNASGATYVAWCWDAGTGSPASNTDGSITSTVKANPAYGFSVVSWAGNGSTATIGHGLNTAPEIVIIKDRDATNNWYFVHNLVDGSNDVLYLNLTDANGNISGASPTSSVFTVEGGRNASGNDQISYCFHSVSGYSDFGSYTGTGASGNTVTTGFKPAFVMIKRTDTSGQSWLMYDNTRDTANPNTKFFFADASNAEVDNTESAIDFDSNGFTVDSTWSDLNASGGTYIYMAFADTREAAFWLDDSGNNNDWENNNLTESDIVLDSPTNNFAVINAVDNTGATLAEGNLKFTPTSDFQFAQGTFACSKNYFEVLFVGTLGGSIEDSTYGVYARNGNSTTINGAGQINKDGSLVSTNTAYVAGDILGIAVDAPSNTIQFYRNGSTNGSSTLNANVEYMPHFKNATGRIGHANFGQDSSFAGNKTPQGNTDANGIGDFYYAPPAGYLALCTSNLPEPAIGPNSDTTSDEHFNTVLWTGNGSTQSITGVGFQPDWVWVKERSSTSEHAAFDVIRGVQKRLVPNSNAAEDTSANLLTAFNLDGFSVGSDGALNQSSQTYVAWNWKANGSGVSNTDGSITSTVSANTDAGFSVVKYTGTGASSFTVGHGLNSAPELVLLKSLDGAYDWSVGSKYIAGDRYLILNKTNNLSGAVGEGFTAHPTDTVINLGYFVGVNGSGNDHIMYCFHSVDGFSKFGSYTGNGSADGPFVYTGFRPAFVMIKRTDVAAAWYTFDSERAESNPVDERLLPNDAQAESTGLNAFDFVSNGLKLRDSNAAWNASGSTYIFACFASNPFKYSNAR